MIIVEWVLNPLTVDARRFILRYFTKFNIYGTNSDSLLLIHHILYIVNPMTPDGIINTNIDLVKLKLNFFDNDVSLLNTKIKG